MSIFPSLSKYQGSQEGTLYKRKRIRTECSENDLVLYRSGAPLGSGVPYNRAFQAIYFRMLETPRSLA
jgi:hypothetical protein